MRIKETHFMKKKKFAKVGKDRDLQKDQNLLKVVVFALLQGNALILLIYVLTELRWFKIEWCWPAAVCELDIYIFIKVFPYYQKQQNFFILVLRNFNLEFSMFKKIYWLFFSFLKQS